MDESKEISYIKNEKWKEDNDEKHGYSLLIGDHMFDRFRVNKSKNGTINSINYLCQSNMDVMHQSLLNQMEQYLDLNLIKKMLNMT